MEPIFTALIFTALYVIFPVPLLLWSIFRVPKRTKMMNFREMVNMATFADYHSSTRHASDADINFSKVDLDDKKDEVIIDIKKELDERVIDMPD
jgi:hypothetical protein